MFWNKKETKETHEAEETKETEKKDDEFVSEFDKRYRVDQNGNYKYHDTPDDPTKKKTETSESTDSSDDTEADNDKSNDGPEREHKNGRNLDDEDDGR